jgi:superfamily I DNA and/or RNA helicase
MAAVNNSDTEQSFRYASVFFPIVNTTCHSFGSVFNINQDSTVPEGFIDTLFMDESGMILVPFLVNLYAGKRVILFGDEKQIEPVYPFKNHKLTCNNVLIDIYGKDAEEKDTMHNRMSVISRTSMSLANDASYFKNPYIQNNLPGDIWLREHFRCRKSIIDFCNQHIYSGYMLPFKKDEENENIKHLYTYNHDFKQDTSGTGRVNKAEVEHILEIVEKGIENKVASSDTLTHGDVCKTIGIITPYAEQEKLLNTHIRKRPKLKGLVAGTVHKFQGSERDMIIFSSTIGPNTSNVGSLFFNRDDFNIINVAVSRAKETFILFGNHAKINEAPLSYIGLLLEHIRQNGKILEVKSKEARE